MKAFFVIPAVAVSVLLALLSLVQAALSADERLAWLGAAAANAPLPAFVAWLHGARVPRTSDSLPLVLLVSALGVIVAAWEAFVQQAAGWLPGAVALVGIVLLLLYVFWYSRYGRFPTARLAVGGKLPEFEVREDDRVLRSGDLLGSAAVFLFHPGNWCPVSMAQLRELAARGGELERLGIALFVISPQPEGRLRELAAEVGAPLRMLHDQGNRAAERLGIDDPDGTPFRFRREYSADTVMPTVIAINASGTILYSDETDNYRVRPEPDVYISILRRTGAIAA